MPLTTPQKLRLLAIALVTVLGGILPPASAGDTVNKTATTMSHENLIGKARSDGSVGVIVGLRMEFQPEGALGPQAVQDQQKTIASLQDAVLARLASHNIASVKRYKYVPSMAMRLDAPALIKLIGAPEVETIAEDIAQPPSQ